MNAELGVIPADIAASVVSAADEVVFALEEIEAPVHGVLENVGGEVLAQTLDHLTPGAMVMSIGMASLKPTTIDFERMRMRAGGARIEALPIPFATLHHERAGQGLRLVVMGAALLFLNAFITPVSQLQNQFLRVNRGVSPTRISLFIIATNIVKADEFIVALNGKGHS